jgi:glutathione synthase/RimK-type ligase-like ATP-grasp enzyme
MPAMTIGEDKALVALLKQGYFDALLTDEQRDAVHRFLPYTVLLQFADGADLRRIIDDKDSMILKPRQEMRGHFVVHGRDFSTESWSALISERRVGDGWLVQEFLPPLGQKIPGIRHDKPAQIEVGETLTAFLLRDSCVGILSRVSEHLANNLHSGGAVQCVISQGPVHDDCAFGSVDSK